MRSRGVPPRHPGAGGRRRALAAGVVLVTAVAAIYLPSAWHPFINYDDGTYISANPVVSRGLTGEGLRWAFGAQAANWHPLTWLSHMLDVELFGLWAGGHHLVSAALHAANAVLVLLVLQAMTRAFWRSAVVAAVFALHPLRVESVAWAAERKDVLAAFFWLLTMAAYLAHARRPGFRRYAAVAALFILGLAAKPMLVTLPFALLLLDFWPLGRAGERDLRRGRPGWPALIREKAPLFALSALASLIALWAQTRGVAPMIDPPFKARLANAAVSFFRYLGDFFWPAGLGILYPFPDGGPALPAAICAGAALAALCLAVLATRRRFPFLATGWLWYVGTLVPVVGLVQVGAQSHADRYTYLPLIGFTIAAVWLVSGWWPRGTRRRVALMLLAAAGLAALTLSARLQVSRWSDVVTLLEHTARVTRGNYLVLNNLGEALFASGRADEALGVLKESARLDPGHCNATYNLGHILLAQRRPGEALAPLESSLECYRRQRLRLDWQSDNLANLALANLQLGRYGEAERRLGEFLRLDPESAWGRESLQFARRMQGKEPPVAPQAPPPPTRSGAPARSSGTR